MAEWQNERLVAVMDGAAILEERVCRILPLPDGRAGALWHGLVFPLSADGRFDIAGPGLAVQACRAAPQARYTIVAGQSESYVLVAGTRQDCDTAAQALRQAGMSVLRSGRYLGAPPEGIEPDWFVRVASAAADHLDAALQPLLAHAGPSAGAEGPAELRSRLLETDLLAARRREAALQAQLATLRLEAAVSAEEAAQQQSLLQEALAEEQRLRAAAEADATAPTPMPRPSVPLRLQEEVTAVLAVLLPRLEMLRESPMVMAAEFASRRSLWRVLGELHAADAIPAGWKKIQGADRWWERHVSNGQDDAGRIYARRTRGTGWQVLVSHKGEQARDIAWLDRQ